MVCCIFVWIFIIAWFIDKDGIYLLVFKNSEFVYGIVALGGIGIVWLVAMFMEIMHINLYSFVSNMIIKNSYGIYLYSDPLNYVIISFLLGTGLITCYESNIGCLAIFFFRIFSTTLIAGLVSHAVFRIKEALKIKGGKSI